MSVPCLFNVNKFLFKITFLFSYFDSINSFYNVYLKNYQSPRVFKKAIVNVVNVLFCIT